ncbi:MAG: M15 family metallopeptidase [Alphaproteobacteria bacterium]|jgi:zinc D-Ala-D-Ala dipeptidase|nr:M15 family metallopeptidase [Alphaproteobacteria bacterium]MBT5389608.1 M15 family metallopeptidase [Alphaproteobacteria bacterium]MBT5540172.1 M15 family metallopeptidase [Alphaproteobacteria bacterium]MBT5654852.1 M15 family metallopeptidase [Alphaproteobacteria bacterium]
MTVPKTVSSPLFPGFSYLEDIDSTILQEVRYAGPHNFIGRPIDGYEAARCVVSDKLGQGIAAVQEEVRKDNYTLKVYDAYRPLRSVVNFAKWAMDLEDLLMKEEFYPEINKAHLFDLGYIGFRSQHSRGCAVDLTLVPLTIPDQDTYRSGDQLVDARLPKGQRFNDNSIEMGTGFDCFDEMSHTACPRISEEAKKNRAYLTKVMETHGFENYEKEWWHFSLKDEPFPETYFDFPVR